MSDQPGCPCSICDEDDYMTDLRTRIAAVLNDSPLLRASIPIYERNWADHLADAVIRELGLEPQVHYDPDCDHYRYVTEWIAPQTKQRVDLP